MFWIIYLILCFNLMGLIVEIFFFLNNRVLFVGFNIWLIICINVVLFDLFVLMK